MMGFDGGEGWHGGKIGPGLWFSDLGLGSIQNNISWFSSEFLWYALV